MIQGQHDTYFTINELADMVGVSPKTVQNWLAEGVIKSVKLGRRRLISLSSIEAALGSFHKERVDIPRTVEREISFVRKDVGEIKKQ